MGYFINLIMVLPNKKEICLPATTKPNLMRQLAVKKERFYSDAIPPERMATAFLKAHLLHKIQTPTIFSKSETKASVQCSCSILKFHPLYSLKVAAKWSSS